LLFCYWLPCYYLVICWLPCVTLLVGLPLPYIVIWTLCIHIQFVYLVLLFTLPHSLRCYLFGSSYLYCCRLVITVTLFDYCYIIVFICCCILTPFIGYLPLLYLFTVILLHLLFWLPFRPIGIVLVIVLILTSYSCYCSPLFIWFLLLDCYIAHCPIVRIWLLLLLPALHCWLLYC